MIFAVTKLAGGAKRAVQTSESTSIMSCNYLTWMAFC